MIALQNVSFSYEKEQEYTLKEINVTAAQGECLLLTGESGCGKTTFIRLLNGLIPHYYEGQLEGNVMINGKEVRTMELYEIAALTGSVFQNPKSQFFTSDVYSELNFICENIGLERTEIERRVAEAVKIFSIENLLERSVTALSGGQKQRVAIARALAVSPDILFCDEATSALDPQTTRSILELLKRLQKDMNLSVVMITHQMEVVRDCCQQVAVIDNGAVAETGFVREIFSAPKSEVTKDFLMHINPLNPEDTQLIRWSKSGGAYTLRFSGELTSEPVLSKISRDYGIEFNICAGGMQKVGETVVGTLFVDINGSPEDMQKAFAYLNQNGIKVEETHQ